MKNKQKTVVSEIDDKLEKEQIQIKISRRGFLKKSAYSAPLLIAMGQLAKPTSIQADGIGSTANGPAGPPGGGWNP